MTPRSCLALLATASLALTACGGSTQETAEAPASNAGATSEQLSVAAGFYPLEFVVARIGGDRVAVEGLTPAGADAHDLELGARQTARVSDADLLVHLSGFQPAVDEAAEQAGEKAFDVASVVQLRQGFEELGHGEAHEGEAHEGEAHEGEGHEGEKGGDQTDPHVWLDPALLATIGGAVAERLAALDPEGAADYRSRAVDLQAELDRLDAEFSEGLGQCARQQMVVSHNAFGYLAARYGLEQVGISGLSPEEEPSPARVAEAARYAKENGVTTIFFETLVSPAVAETVASEVGATTAVLDPIEGRPEGGDYLSGMRNNLEALRTALDCS
jgi:zinc transport system substrate-binding protein